MAVDVTTGPEIMGTAAGFVAFCAFGAAFTRYVAMPMWRFMGAEQANRTARVSFWIWEVLGAIGMVAFAVGVIAWLTNTTFDAT
jgi:hypothetical protein